MNYALLISNSPGEVIDGVVVVPGVLGTVTITGNNKTKYVPLKFI